VRRRPGGKVEEAKGAALKILSSRSHSRKELRAKLEERGHAPEAIAAALDRLEAVGLQSDAEFAEVFARSKWRQTKWGPSRIKAVGCDRPIVAHPRTVHRRRLAALTSAQRTTLLLTPARSARLLRAPRRS
jgi:hypothetical protein